MILDADLHIHGLHSGGVSDKMKIPVLAEQAGIKGLDLVSTGDILNPDWRRHVRKTTEDLGNGIYRRNGTDFVLSTEIEDENRVHHLVFLPSIEASVELAEKIEPHSSDIRKEGRPRVSLDGENIARIVKDFGGLFGPSHGFTPWTSVYKEHDSLESCYGSMVEEIDFLELGLSADTSMADEIKELNSLTFLSNSDAHSPWPDKIGREFNRIKVKGRSFEELDRALNRKGERGIELNVGFDPREGKYHCTACQSCYQKYSYEQAVNREWKCGKCGKSIKKGVKDKVTELSDGGNSPEWRGDYIHLIPLAEIIKEVVGHSSTKTKTVQKIYDDFQSEFPSEIEILLEEKLEDLREVNSKVSEAVSKFRKQKIVMIPGGGGKYGSIRIPRDEEDRKNIIEENQHEIKCRFKDNQKSLSDF